MIIKKEGLTEREDNIFFLIAKGHYNLETYENLSEYYSGLNIPQAWEYSDVITMHDPDDTYKSIVKKGQAFVISKMYELVKDKYLKFQLILDWLMHPLKRGDSVSVFLHCSDLLRNMCQMSYLLDDRCYPHDKWIYYYLPTTNFGKENHSLILDYMECIGKYSEITKGKDLHEYIQYEKAANIISKTTDYIKNKYDNQNWLDEWWLYV